MHYCETSGFCIATGVEGYVPNVNKSGDSINDKWEDQKSIFQCDGSRRKRDDRVGRNVVTEKGRRVGVKLIASTAGRKTYGGRLALGSKTTSKAAYTDAGDNHTMKHPEFIPEGITIQDSFERSHGVRI